MTKIKDLNKSRKGGNITGAEWIRNNKYIYENGKIELGLIQLRDVQNPTDMLRQQLISEGKEDYYVISFTSLGGTFTMQMLPIYGNANEYVTRWFSPSAQEAIELFKRESGGNIAKILKGPVDENGNIISRKGSRKGSEYDLIDNIISVAEREYGDLEDLTQTQADKVCETVAGITGESVENVKAQLREMDELNGVTRQGSRKGQDFTAQGITNVANAFKDITTKKIPDAIGKMKKERDGSRKGSTVQRIVDAFDNPDIPDEELLRIARELPYGIGEEVLKKLFVGSWRGDDPIEKEFFRIIESKISRNGSRKGQDFTAQGITNVANAFKDITTKKIPDAIGKMKKEREGSRKGSLKGNSSSAVEEKYGKVVADKLRLADRNYDLFLPDNSIMSKYDVTQEQLDFYRSVMGYQQSREGSRKGGTVTFKDVIDYFENLQETSPKDDDELWDEALNKFGVTTDLGKFDSSEFATYYYGSGTKSTNTIPDDMMVSGRNGSRKGTGPLCDLGSVSGKGSRPENLGSIASKVALGRNRSVNMDGEYNEQESRVGSRLGAQKNDYVSWFKEFRKYDTDDQQELEELAEDDFELMTRAANQYGLSLYEAALYRSYLEENNGHDNSLRLANQYASGDNNILPPWEDKPLWDRFPDARMGKRKGDPTTGLQNSVNMDGEYNEQESRKGSYGEDPLVQQIIGDNVEEDSDGYNFYDARNALRLEGYSEDEIEDNIDTWMYQHMN